MHWLFYVIKIYHYHIKIGFGLQCYDCQVSLTNLLPACMTSDEDLGTLKECSADQNACFKIHGGVMNDYLF